MTPSQTLPGPEHPGARARRRARSGAEPTAYDFRRPMQLSREHTRLLEMSLDGFARQLGAVFTAALRTVCFAQLVGVEQQSYSEHVDTLEEITYAVKLGLEPVQGLGLLGLPLPAVMGAIDHMLGGPGTEAQPRRPLTDIESAVVRDLIARLLGELGHSLSGVVAVSPALLGVEYNPQLAQVAAPGEAVVVAAFDLLVNERRHRVTLCLPFAGLHPHLVRAAAPAPVSDHERQQRSRSAALVDRRFQDVPVDTVVRFRPTRLGPAELTGLAVGDVLRLAHKSATPLDVVVGETTFAHATAGTHGARLAALVVGPTKENA